MSANINHQRTVRIFFHNKIIDIISFDLYDGIHPIKHKLIKMEHWFGHRTRFRNNYIFPFSSVKRYCPYELHSEGTSSWERILLSTNSTIIFSQVKRNAFLSICCMQYVSWTDCGPPLTIFALCINVISMHQVFAPNVADILKKRFLNMHDSLTIPIIYSVSLSI